MPRKPVNDGDARPTAFVSYAHGDAAWNATVLDFATALRTVGGIDADIDQWHIIGGHDWRTYGPSAIEHSDFVLLAVSPTYRDAWEDKNPSDRNAGAAGEADAVEAILRTAQSEFEQRVRVVLLHGSGAASVPAVLRSVNRFEVTSFDEQGMEMILRSLLNKPPHVMPTLGPLPALPPYALADMQAESRPGGEPVAEVAEPPPDGAGADRASADALDAQLEAIDLRIAAGRTGERAGDAMGGRPDARLLDERSAAKASLEAVERTLPMGVARQRMVGNYLKAQLCLSAGAFQAADRRLTALHDRLGDPARYPGDAVLEPCLRQLSEVMLTLNERMRTRRHVAATGYRHPDPPGLELGQEHTSGVGEFYEIARRAMYEGSASGSLGDIRTVILRGREPAEKHAARLYARYTEQQVIAARSLELADPSPSGNRAGAQRLAHADLHDPEDGVAADVLVALAKAHLELHVVERRRSGPVGAILGRGKDDVGKDREHLRHSIVLNTFALAISETLPWIFAADKSERREVQSNPAKARRDLTPAPAVWHARQVTLLALYRRSHGFRLLGDHERAYNDLRMLQRVGRLTRSAAKDNPAVTGWVDTLEALAEYRIGELYRADHDYMQALVHLCRSHDSVQTIADRRESAIAHELGHLQIKLSLGKGKAFFEIGAMKRSLKWHLTAWRWLLVLESPHTKLKDGIVAVEKELDRLKHDLVLYKDDVQDAIATIVEQMCEHDLAPCHSALEADILVRISHLLTVLRLPEDAHDQPPDGTSSALRCMQRAAKLDPHNLLVQTGLLRYEMRRPGSITDRPMADPMVCWPSGASDVDQVIRAAEHLMLEWLHAAGGPKDKTGDVGVAQALMGHFTTHTDSINLRGAILHRYLMRRRVEDREPWWADAAAESEHATQAATMGRSAPYLEFVCLRRFGSFTPFMPRPAAVSAVGGGYLVRIVRSSDDADHDHPRMFNIVVDPGEGAVNNLYAMGLSIADIDMVVATHDHPEHLAALDAILSLRRELHERERVSPVGPDHVSARGGDRHLLILGNRSVVNRYSFLNGDGHHLVQHIADASVLGGLRIPDGVKLEELRTKHKDLGGHHASGFMLSLSSPEWGATRLRIAFMADTSVEGLREDGDPDKPIDARWKSALESDIVVAHVSDVPSGELRGLAKLPTPVDQDAIDEFDAGVRKMAAERPADASQLMHALSLVPPDPDADPQPLSIVSQATMDGGEQLFLHGLLDVCGRMSKVPAALGASARILIVGELKEQLGSFRGTIAREINGRMLNLPLERHGPDAPPLIALTADIGLRIRLTATTTAGGDVRGTNTVLCSTCSYNNDRLDMERFHPPQDIYDVCVKGDHEAMYWNCDLHDPGLRKRPMFVEQMGGYNPFAAGGRYHG